MRFLRTNTSAVLTVGPFYDKTDGVTIETALTISNERITLTADTDDNAAPTLILDNVTGATSGSNNDLNYITNNDAGLMQLQLQAANVNRLGRLFLTITDAANHVPVFHELLVLPAMIYDAFILGTDTLQADVTQISGAAVSTSTAQLGVNAVNIGGTAQTGRDLGSSVLIAVGNNAGMLNITAGVVQASIASGGITTSSFAAGAIDAAAIADNAIDAGAIAADAITAAKIANGAIDAATFAAGAIDATAIATGAIDADAIADGAIDAATFAAGAITAAAIATNAIDADALAADAVTEIQAGLATSAEVAAVQADTDDIQTRLPAALVAGRIDASVGAVANNAITAAAIASNAIDADALATDAVTEIADGLLDRDMSAGADVNARSPRNALRFLRNKWTNAAGTLTVTKEDDTTTAWTGTVTTDAAADPVTAVDPA